MRHSIACGLGALGVLLSSLPAAAQERPTTENRASDEVVPDTAGDGPYRSIMEIDPSLPGHVVYRPENLQSLGDKRLGVLVWGNGGCSADGTSARLHLAQIASHGYLVIAPGGWHSGPNAKSAPPPRRGPGPDGRMPPPATSTADVSAGIDWALAENQREGSRFHQKIDPAAVAVGGHSCGGLQAIELGADPRVATVLVHNSGIFNGGEQGISGMQVEKAMLNALHTPVLYVLGGTEDVAWPNGSDDFARIEHVPAVLVDAPVGHGGTFGQPLGGAVAHIAVDWLDWQLRDDRSAARTFMGENCRLCSGSKWTIERKNWPEIALSQ